MYIMKNAWKSIIRNKGRNIMILIITLVIAVTACVSLSIREAAETAKEETAKNLTISAQLTFDRTSAMQNMQEERENEGFDRKRFDFDSLGGSSLTLDDYMKYTEYLSGNDSYYYVVTTSMNGNDSLLPYGTEETEENRSSDMPDMDRQDKPEGGLKGMASGDFTLTGYSSYDALMTMFGEDGSYTIEEGEMFDEKDASYTCIVSNELAMYNNLNVGDILTLENPNYEGETYDFVISGIYANAAADEGNSPFSRSDPANNIYLNTAALSALCEASESAGNMVAGEDGEEMVSAAVTGEVTFTYVFSAVDEYENFKEKAEEAGLPDQYVLSSNDLSAYENSLMPLNTLSTMTGWFFLIVLVIGGIILVVINMFNLRERKYEVGVLSAIGMKKHKVIAQFVCELFLITFSAIVLGAGIGASLSVPVTNTLLEAQVEKTEASAQQINNNFGFKGGDPGEGRFGGGEAQGERPVMEGTPGRMADYIDTVSSATDLNVLFQMILVGALLTVLSSIAALITILQYEPLQILSSR